MLVPVIGINAEGIGVLSEDKWALGIEPAVEGGAARSGRYPDDKRILAGVTLGGMINVEVGLLSIDLKEAGEEGLDGELEGEVENIDPISLVFGLDPQYDQADSQYDPHVHESNI